MDIQTLSVFKEPIHIVVLPNGFTVIQIEKNSELLTANLVFAAGSMDDKVEGEAHFLEHLVHGGRHQGGFHPALRAFEEQVGLRDSNASTDTGATEYYGTTWRRSARQFIEILGEMVSAPQLTERAVELERSIIRSEILRRLSEQRANEAFLSTLFPSRRDLVHSTGGTPDSIEKITAEGLQRFHRESYTASRCALVVEGSGDIKEFAEWIAPFAARLPAGNHGDHKRGSQKELEQFGFRQLTSERAQSIELDFIGAGVEIGLEMLLFNMSRTFLMDPGYGILYRALRHERGLVYDIGSSATTGPFQYSSLDTSGMDAARVEEIIEVVQTTMRSVTLDTFDERRLEQMKRGALMTETMAMEGGIGYDLITRCWLRDQLLTMNPREMYRKVTLLTRADMLETHQRHWEPDRMLIIRTDPTPP